MLDAKHDKTRMATHIVSHDTPPWLRQFVSLRFTGTIWTKHLLVSWRFFTSQFFMTLVITIFHFVTKGMREVPWTLVRKKCYSLAAVFVSVETRESSSGRHGSAWDSFGSGNKVDSGLVCSWQNTGCCKSVSTTFSAENAVILTLALADRRPVQPNQKPIERVHWLPRDQFLGW